MSISVPQLTVCIPTKNDQAECVATIKSIRETAGWEPWIAVVDDASDAPVVIPEELQRKLFLHKCPSRIGGPAARDLCAQMSFTDYLVWFDSHMRCSPGWYEAAMKRIVGRPTTVHNGNCLGLGLGVEGPDPMDLTKSVGSYYGARMVFWEEQGNAIFEGRWNPAPVADDAEIQCLMGAIYFIPKEFFHRIGGYRGLKGWGTEEPLISYKTWLAGGEVRQCNTVKIGHKFRANTPYTMAVTELVYNKIRTALTLFPKDVAEFLISKVVEDGNKAAALQLLKAEWPEVLNEFQFNQGIFKHDLQWFCNKFGLVYPTRENMETKNVATPMAA